MSRRVNASRRDDCPNYKVPAPYRFGFCAAPCCELVSTLQGACSERESHEKSSVVTGRRRAGTRIRRGLHSGTEPRAPCLGHVSLLHGKCWHTSRRGLLVSPRRHDVRAVRPRDAHARGRLAPHAPPFPCCQFRIPMVSTLTALVRRPSTASRFAPARLAAAHERPLPRPGPRPNYMAGA